MVPFITRYKATLTFDSVDEILSVFRLGHATQLQSWLNAPRLLNVGQNV